jgi:hypothetical protein
MRFGRKVIYCVCNLEQHAVLEKLVESVTKILFKFPSEDNSNLPNKIKLKVPALDLLRVSLSLLET